MITAIDTNILLDILKNDSQHVEQSKKIIQEYHQKGVLRICPIVYAELLYFFIEKFPQQEHAMDKLEAFLHAFDITVLDFSKQDAYHAAQQWTLYLQQKKNAVSCPTCGKQNIIHCQHCHTKINWRNHIVTDFLIGAHAFNRATVLLTRDHGFYKKYFSLNIVG